MSVSQVSWIALALIGAMLLGTAQLLESGLIAQREKAQQVLYENIGLIAPQLRQELLADLKARTGLDVHRVEVQEIDLLRPCARLVVYYCEP